jgi:2-methylisocitrate lyase-like PEP mutase family enzyme
VTSQAAKAQDLRALHVPGDPLVLTNVWDVASARVVAATPGARAIATASMAVSALYGVPDGEGLSVEQALDMATRICAAVELPVTVDFEAGYAPDPEGVRINVTRLIATGAVGLNLEDTRRAPDDLFGLEEQVARVRAVRRAADETGVPIVLNARADGLVRGRDWADTRERAIAYLDAGADSVFVLGLRDDAAVTRAVQEIPGPVALIATRSSPPLVRLAELGVARISFAGGLHRVAMAAVRAACETLLARGDLPTELDPRD